MEFVAKHNKMKDNLTHHKERAERKVKHDYYAKNEAFSQSELIEQSYLECAASNHGSI